MASISVEAVRKHFPALAQPQVYFDNAGGSQILGTAADSIRDYLYTHNVQLGATYKAGEQSTEAYSKGLAAAAEYINAKPNEIVIGPSTTQLFRNLSVALLPYLQKHPSPELVISTVDHEANIASWVYLSKIVPHLTLRYWTPKTPSHANPHLTPETLKPLLTSNTVLVTCTHTSNILGSITDIRAIADTVHSVPRAMLCVDGVAFAPHRPLDVKALGVDFYAFSWYKLFGPHIAQLYCSRKAQDAAMTSLGHYFKEGHDLEEKLGLAGASYELVQAIPTVTKYLRDTGWKGMVAQEEILSRTLIDYLNSKPDVYTIFGEPNPDSDKRVPVISFGVKGRNSREVVEKVERSSDFGFRWGHFYSKRLLDDILGLGDDGVVRVSMLHYNTVEEVKAYIEALDKEVCGR